MSKFDLAISQILQNEGGYQNNANDRGNYNSRNELVGTNFGISAPTYEDWVGHPPTQSEIKNMTESTAWIIYKKNYWDKYYLSEIKDQYLAEHIFDLFVNHSPGEATHIVQQSINDIQPNMVVIDDRWGSKTRGGVNELTNQDKAQELNDLIVDNRVDYYQSLGNNTFINGWKNRANSWLGYVNLNQDVGSMVMTGVVFFCCFFSVKI